MNRLGLCSLFPFAVQIAFGQLEVPTKVILDGATSDKRQVLGLALPSSGTSGATMASDRTDATTFSTATGNNALAVTLAPAPTSLLPGMRITFLPSALSTGEATLNVNGLGAIPLRKNVNAQLDSADLRPGRPVDVVFDGLVFQVTSQLYPSCPPGYKAVGTTVCIEAVPRDSSNWYAAVSTCVGEGKRMCGFTDWFQACLQADNIFSTVASYEWVDHAANSNNYAKLVGIGEVTQLPDCRDGSRQIPTVPHPYRCCYDR